MNADTASINAQINIRSVVESLGAEFRGNRARCVTCEPETENEAAARIAKENTAPKFSIMNFLKAAEREA